MHFRHAPPLLFDCQQSNILVELNAKSTIESQLGLILESVKKSISDVDVLCCDTVESMHCSLLEKYEDGYISRNAFPLTTIVKDALRCSPGTIPRLLLWCNHNMRDLTLLSAPPKKLHVVYLPHLHPETFEAVLHLPTSTSIADVCRFACRAVKALRCNVTITTSSDRRLLSSLGKIVDASLLMMTWADITDDTVIIADAIANTLSRDNLTLELTALSDTCHSVVYRGKFYTLDVAIKILRGSATKSARDLRAELAVLSKLRHPKILTMVGIVENLMALEGSVAIVSEFMSRGSLYDVLHLPMTQSCDRLSSTISKLRVLQDIADGMRFLHANNVIHRDLKSPNVLLNSDGHAKICDFGSSAIMQDSQTHATGIFGTAAWSSPEALDSLDVRPPTDVYSFGVIMWEIFTGIVPWNGFSVLQICAKKSRGEHLPLQPLLEVFPSLQPLVAICFESNPISRPAFTDLYDDLTRVLMQEKELNHTPHAYLCPISLELMNDPVACSDGHVYERSSIERWLETSTHSPCTGLPLEHLILTPVHALRSLIEEHNATPRN